MSHPTGGTPADEPLSCPPSEAGYEQQLPLFDEGALDIADFLREEPEERALPEHAPSRASRR